MEQMNGIYKLVTAAEARPGAGTAGLPGTRWQVFRAVLSARFGALVKTNLMMLLFALPAIIVFFLNLSENAQSLAVLPFSSNAGAGYPYFDDAVSLYNHAVFENGIRFAYLLIPAVIIGAIGLGGGLHVIGMLFSGENIPVTRTFLKGLRRNAWQSAVASVLAALAVGLAVFYVSYMRVSSLNPFWSVTLLILIILLLILILFFSMYLLTQIESYKSRFWPLVKNSFAFSLGKALPNIIFMLLSVAPMSVILFLSGNTLISFLIFLVLGLLAFSWLALLWSVHTRHVYQGFFGRDEAEAVTVSDAAIKNAALRGAESKAGNNAAGTPAPAIAPAPARRSQGAGNKPGNKHGGHGKKHGKKGKKR